jgi:purine nucleosidase
MAQTKIILDIDNALTLPVQDTDDAIALALAMVSPELDLMGITTCAGNCRTAQSTENTLRMLQLAGAVSLPVSQGRAEPLLRDRRAHFRYLAAKSAGAGARFWRALPAPPAVTIRPLAVPAHEFIVRSVFRWPGEITYIALGSFTNLALAMLTAPDLAPKLKRVVHMGGVCPPASGEPFVWSTPDIPDEVWRTTLRFNTTFDPEASAVVFNSGVALTFITANVTSRVFQRREHLDRLAAAASPFHRLLHAYARPWVDWSMAERRLPGAHMHDPLTVAAVIDPTFCRLETLSLDVQAFLAGENHWLRRRPGGRAVQVATGVDGPRFEAFLAKRLSQPVQPVYRPARSP